MSNNNKHALIQALNATALFDNRYQITNVVNCDPLTGAHLPNGGTLSVIFKALDTSTNCNVAIKFFDPDKMQAGVQFQYRQDLFNREVDVLKLLRGNLRHLQLIEEIKSFNLSLSSLTGITLTLPVSYFVIEWIENDILDYFYNQTGYTTIEKLELFRKICLSVFNLHSLGICHRDIKPDNIRIRNIGSLDVVIIDMGTAKQINSPLVGLAANYSKTVGANGYSPIESWLGLSMISSVGISTDTYAIGCLLYELFNVSLFTQKLHSDVGFRNCYGQCSAYLLPVLSSNPTDQQLMKQFRHAILQTKQQVNLPQIDDLSSTIDPPAKGLIGHLLRNLAAVDLHDRCYDHNRILRQIDSACKAITRADEYKRRQALRRRYRKVVNKIQPS